MIDLFVGKPRNGKSLRAMMRILDRLINTKRFIVTNMVLDLDRIQDYIDKRGLNINARTRFHFLTTKEDMKNFWLFRDYGLVLKKPADYDDAKGKSDIDYAPLFDDERFWTKTEVGQVPQMAGTFYVIDEVHTLFPARGWQGTPRHADFYNSQHGKLNDEVVFITQNTKLVDPNFYRLAQEFHYCRNHRLMKHGHFKGANKFTAHIYDGPANDNGKPTLNVESFSLDLEVAQCYDTSAGVGMPGGGAADAGHRTKGVPLWSIWVACGLAICGVYYVFNYVIPQAGNKYLRAMKSGTLRPGEPLPTVPGAPIVDGVATASPSISPSNSPEVGPFSSSKDDGLVIEKIYETKIPDSPLYVTGYVKKQNRINVVLSDGRILTEKDSDILKIERNTVFLRSGERIFIGTPRKPYLKPSVISPQGEVFQYIKPPKAAT
jgi:hypothetical protein